MALNYSSFSTPEETKRLLQEAPGEDISGMLVNTRSGYKWYLMKEFRLARTIEILPDTGSNRSEKRSRVSISGDVNFDRSLLQQSLEPV